jgi:hypothetical protein
VRVRWFGRPWPDDEYRAPVCDDDYYRVDTPVGQSCLWCPDLVAEHDRGVLMAADGDFPETFIIRLAEKDSSPALWNVGAVHIDCLVRITLGPELAKRVAPRRDGRRASELGPPPPPTPIRPEHRH